MTLRAAEIRIMANHNFWRRLMNYTHDDPVERATQAWYDTDAYNLDDQPFSEDFEKMLCAFVEAHNEVEL